MDRLADDRRAGPERRRLDPAHDPARWEATVRRFVEAAGPELSRRRRWRGEAPGLLFDRWALPLLAAAASLLLLLAGASLVRGPAAGIGGSGELTAPRLEDVLFPPVVARWIAEEAEPTVEEVVFTASSGGAP